jgi:hypothetical protein
MPKKPGTPAARGEPPSEDDENGDDAPTLQHIAAVLNDIQTQLGGYGARLAAIEQAGAEDDETDAGAGVGQGGEPPAPAPQCARPGCLRPAYPNPQGGFYRHCGRTCYSQDTEAGADDTRSDAGRSDASSRYMLGPPSARHIVLTDTSLELVILSGC